MAKHTGKSRPRNWLAVHAHNRRGGPMRMRRDAGPSVGEWAQDYKPCEVCAEPTSSFVYDTQWCGACDPRDWIDTQGKESPCESESPLSKGDTRTHQEDA